ncbi:MAG: hypothetical protein RIF32_13995 [Leptospirales bacterium]|jgi:hypothetical protein
MALTSRGAAWEWMQSWYIVLTFPYLFLNWAAFFYTGLRAGKIKWHLAGIVYLGGLVGLFVMTDMYPDGAQRPPWFDWVMAGSFALWLTSIVHAVLIRKEYLLHLEARQLHGARAEDRMKSEIHSSYGLAGNRIDEMLIEFKQDDLTVKLCGGLFGVLPFAPDFKYYFNMKGAAATVGADAALAERATSLAARDEFAQAIKVVKALDTIDSGLGVFTGIRNVYSKIKDKERKRTFEADPQQAADAAVKLLGISYMIATLYPGGVSEKVSGFLQTRAGKELALYYASVELALPFTDNLLEGGANMLDNILSAHQGDMEQRFTAFASGTPLSDVQPILFQLKDQITAVLAQVKVYVDPLTARLESFVPQAMNVADSATGAAATAIDMMPAYRFLGARLAAEAAVLRASRGEA